MGNSIAAGLLACCSDGAFSARRPMASCHREKQLTVAGQRRTLTGFPIVRTQARHHPFLGASRLCGTASDCKITHFSPNGKAPAAFFLQDNFPPPFAIVFAKGYFCADKSDFHDFISACFDTRADGLVLATAVAKYASQLWPSIGHYCGQVCVTAVAMTTKCRLRTSPSALPTIFPCRALWLPSVKKYCCPGKKNAIFCIVCKCRRYGGLSRGGAYFSPEGA